MLSLPAPAPVPAAPVPAPCPLPLRRQQGAASPKKKLGRLQRRFLVKWASIAHLHCTWETEEVLPSTHVQPPRKPSIARAKCIAASDAPDKAVIPHSLL